MFHCRVQTCLCDPVILARKYEFVPADIPIIERLKAAWIHKNANGVFTSGDLSTDESQNI